MNPQLIVCCRDKLIQVSRQRSTIAYSELAAHLRVARQSIGPCLTAVYNDLVLGRGLPDLTLLVVYKGTPYGAFNSRGSSAQSVKFDPTDPDQCTLYDADRTEVYKYWA